MGKEHHSQPRDSTTSEASFFRSRAFYVLLGFLAIAVVLLWQEHQAHILGGGLLLLLLACPLMHVFMHGGHSHHSGSAENKVRDVTDTKSSTKGDADHD